MPKGPNNAGQGAKVGSTYMRDGKKAKPTRMDKKGPNQE
jgi:hypothetical protein